MKAAASEEPELPLFAQMSCHECHVSSEPELEFGLAGARHSLWTHAVRTPDLTSEIAPRRIRVDWWARHRIDGAGQWLEKCRTEIAGRRVVSLRCFQDSQVWRRPQLPLYTHHRIALGAPIHGRTFALHKRGRSSGYVRACVGAFAGGGPTSGESAQVDASVCVVPLQPMSPAERESCAATTRTIGR